MDECRVTEAAVKRAKRADREVAGEGRRPPPRDPLAPEFRQGNTLGRERRHWFRARFGGNRFLFSPENSDFGALNGKHLRLLKKADPSPLSVSQRMDFGELR